MTHFQVLAYGFGCACFAVVESAVNRVLLDKYVAVAALTVSIDAIVADYG